MCYDIFLSLRTNTENASFQHNEHQFINISSNALFGNSANNFLEPFS